MIIEIENLKPGMRLLQDVVLPNGAILVNSAQPVTAYLIEALKKKGITRIHAAMVEPESAPVEPVAEEDPIDERREGDVPPQAGTPSIKVMVSPCGMSARLVVEPLQDCQNWLEHADISEALANAGVTHGINDQAITGLLEKWTRLIKLYDVANVATGTPAQPAREGGIGMSIGHLSKDAEILQARQAKHIWALKLDGITPERVDPGTVIAKRVPSSMPIPGIDVYGNPVFADEVIKVSSRLDSSVHFNADGSEICSRVSGLAFCSEHSLIGVVEISFDGAAEVEIVDNGMRAFLTIRPPGTGGRFPTLSAIDKLMFDQNIRYGIKQDAIKELCDQMKSGMSPADPVLVAEGTKPVNGENGKIEFLFNTESSLKPMQNPDGSVDYKNVDIIHSVEQGCELAKLLPPTKGTPGKDVFGRESLAVDGSPAYLPSGPNTEVSPEKADVLIASVTGNVRFSKAVVEVSEGFIIKGNVDYSSGNINYAKSVTVNGDICSGFVVECGGDLQVNGTIDDANVNVGGNVLVKYGFVGQGKGSVITKGDVNFGFVKNQTIRCRGTVNIAREALNATIYARKAIVVHGNPLSVAGGNLIARDFIEVHTVGTFGGIRTNLEVGVDFTLIDELKKSEIQLADVTTSLNKILTLYKKYDQMMKMRRSLPPKDMELFKKLRDSLVKHHQQTKVLELRVEMVKTKMLKVDNAYVRIIHSAMPGTLIKIGERHFMVKDEIIGPKIVRMVNFEVRLL